MFFVQIQERDGSWEEYLETSSQELDYAISVCNGAATVFGRTCRVIDIENLDYLNAGNLHVIHEVFCNSQDHDDPGMWLNVPKEDNKIPWQEVGF